MPLHRGWSVALCALFAHCVPSSAEVPCGDLVCAAPKVCAPVTGACVDEAQLTACAGVTAGGACVLVGVGAGICRDEVCVVGGCGDGVVDQGEACDDGNRVEDDACSNACALPTCGDAILQGAERCDQGAANGDDRDCTSRCLLATCGDNLVLAGLEACDAGAANADDGACTTACARARCGDGLVFVGVEACDDGNLDSADGCRADCRKVEVCGDAVPDAGEACDDGDVNPADGCDACVTTSWSATAVLGGNLVGTEAGLFNPFGAAVDGEGRVYVADTDNFRVRRIDRDGSLTTVAGTTTFGLSADGEPATSSWLFAPWAVAVDGLGRIFIAETFNHRVRRVDLDGSIWTLAGQGGEGFAGDGGPATSAQLRYPAGLAVDGLGQVFIADRDNHRVRKIGLDGIITTVAGTGVAGSTGDDGPGTAAQLARPIALALDGGGGLLIAEYDGHRVRRLDPDGTIRRFAGNGAFGLSGDGGPAQSAALGSPAGLAIDPAGRVLVTSQSYSTIRRIDLDGTISSIAGGVAQGEGIPALGAALFGPAGIAVTAQGEIAVVETWRGRVRRIDADGLITTIAGNGLIGEQGDGGAATAARFQFPFQLAVDPGGRVHVADNYHHRVRRIEPDGTIVGVAGNGSVNSSGDGGPALEAGILYPKDLAFDALGRLLVADSDGHVIRRVDAAGVITSVVGAVGRGAGDSGDGGPAVDAYLNRPQGVLARPDGSIYVADTNNHRVRYVDPDGMITTVAGDGTPGDAGDGGPATSAHLRFPTDVAVDADGRLLIADSENHKVRVVDDGTITTLAGLGVPGFGGDGGPAAAATLHYPWSICPDFDGGVLIADAENQRLRRVDASGVITTLAGDGTNASSGDGGAAAAAQLGNPTGVAQTADGTIYVMEVGGGRVRRIDPVDATISTIAGAVDPLGVGPSARARLATPRAMVRTADATLVATGVAGVIEAFDESTGWLRAAIGRYAHPVATGQLARLRDDGFGEVGGVAWDAAAGRIYLTETNHHRLHVVDLVDPGDVFTWTIAPLAGQDEVAAFRDGPAANAWFRRPTALFFDETSRVLYIADTGNHVVRALAVDAGIVSTVAGTPATRGYFGDGLAADAALLYAPQGLTRCGDDLFVADTGNHRVRRIDEGGVISTVLGDGVAASSGEGAPATTFPVDGPTGLACDATGNLYVTSSATLRLLIADASGVVDGRGRVQTVYGAPPRDTFPASVTTCLLDVDLVDDHTVDVIDGCDGLLVRLSRAPRVP